MSIELPLYVQEKRNTCALACLRMVLAAFGTHIPEAAIAAQAKLEEKGTLIDELERLARHFQLAAEIQEISLSEMPGILADGKFPIAFIDRAIFALTPEQRRKHSLRDAKIHTVIPTLVTGKFVTFHDPLPPRVSRKSVRLFRQAYSALEAFQLYAANRKDRNSLVGYLASRSRRLAMRASYLEMRRLPADDN